MRLKEAEWRIEPAGAGNGMDYQMVLSGDLWMTHYMLVFVVSFFGSIFLAIFSVKANGDLNYQRWLVSILLISAPLTVVCLRAKRNDLRFKRYGTQNDPISNCNMVRAIAESHGWEVQRDDEASLLQIGIPKSQSSWTEGEILTVFFKQSEVFVNCIPYPWGRSSALSAWTPAKRRMQTVAEAVGGTKA